MAPSASSHKKGVGGTRALAHSIFDTLDDIDRFPAVSASFIILNAFPAMLVYSRFHFWSKKSQVRHHEHADSLQVAPRQTSRWMAPKHASASISSPCVFVGMVQKRSPGVS